MAGAALSANLTNPERGNPRAGAKCVVGVAPQTQRMSRPGTIASVVDVIEEAARDAAGQLLRESGSVEPPMVHILIEGGTPDYAGYISSRPYYRGADAAAAIAGMGALPSALRATHLVVIWENADVYTALEAPGGPFEEALAVLEVSMAGHTLRWHPFELRIGPFNEAGAPTADPEWGQTARYPNGPLPEPIEGLVRLWRQWRPAEVTQLADSLRQAGYQVGLVPR